VTPDETIVVTGIPRSGTTCMMRMIEAAGIPLYYDTDKPLEFVEHGESFINYNIILRETRNVAWLKDGNDEWLDWCKGKAIKILTPAKATIPKRGRYRFIWMDRKAKHCIRSNRKFMLRAPGHRDLIAPSMLMDSARFTDTDVLRMYIEDQRRRGLAMLRSYPNSRLIIVKFEDMIRKPVRVAVKIVQFLGLQDSSLIIRAMADIVVKRPVHCLPGMLEEKIYA
jgi:hypothetical protein